MEPVEGFDATQEKELKSRKRTRPESSEAQKWRAIFSILFPHVLARDVPSPCKLARACFHSVPHAETCLLDYEYEHLQNLETGSLGSLALCEEYILREVPSRLRQELRPALDRNLTVVEESLRQMASERIRDILRDVFREFRDMHQPNSPLTRSTRVVPTQDDASQAQTTFSQPVTNQAETVAGVTEGEELPFFAFSDADFSIMFEEFSYDTNHFLGSLTVTETGSGSKVQSDSGYDSINPLSARSALSEI